MNGANHYIYEFGPFRLDARKRLLWRAGEIVTLTPKAFDTLLALVEANGQVVEKDKLMQRVWPNTAVEEGNLTFNISSLRKTLGDDPRRHQFIVTIPGEGYQFVAGVRAAFDEVEVRERTRVTIEEEAKPLEQLRNGHDQATQTALVQTVVRSHRPRPTVRYAVAGGLAVAFLITIGGIGLWRYRIGRASRVPAPIPFQSFNIKRLTNLGNVANAALSPDGKLFVYSIQEKDGRASLWLGHVEGGAPIQLRPAAELRYLDLAFAPDASSLYYLESQAFAPGTLYRMPVFGGAPEKIKAGIPDDLTFSPDGAHFAFVRGDDSAKKSTVVVADRDGANEHVIASRPNHTAFVNATPAWSPDGSIIAVAAITNEQSREREVFVVNVSDGAIRQLTGRRWNSIYALEWFKDSRGLVMAAKDKEGGLYSQLWHVSYPTGEITRIVADLNSYSSVLSLSRESSALLTMQTQSYTNIWIAPADNLNQAKQITFGTRTVGTYGIDWTPEDRVIYTGYVDQSQTLWSMDHDSGIQKQILPTGHTNNTVSVTEDGRYIIFQSDRSGSMEVWRANIDGSDMRQLTAGGNNVEPHVAPKGKWIVYRSGSDGALWRISIDGGKPERVTNRAAAWPRISPDGKLVACAYDADGANKLAIVPIEGGPPIKLFDFPRLANFNYGMRWTPDGKAVTYHDWGHGVWRQSLDGGNPQRLEGLPEEKLFAHAWSRDGRLFAFVRGVQMRDLVLIQDTK